MVNDLRALLNPGREYPEILALFDAPANDMDERSRRQLENYSGHLVAPLNARDTDVKLDLPVIPPSRYCDFCGLPQPADKNFCTNCGTPSQPLESAPSPQPPDQLPVVEVYDGGQTIIVRGAGNILDAARVLLAVVGVSMRS